MKKLRNLKHILAIGLISLTLIFGSIMIFSAEFSNSLNGFFVYRTTGGVWQDMIYTHTLHPSTDIAIVAIDDKTINTFQSSGDQRMLTIPKSRYGELIEKLEIAGVRGIAFDIVFQNPDTEEKVFATTLAKYKNIIIGTSIYGQSGSGNCTTDGSGGITCGGSPRNTYTAIPWGSIDVGRLYDRDDGIVQSANRSSQGGEAAYMRSVRIDIGSRESSRGIETPGGSWKYALGLSTEIYSLPIGLAHIVDERLTRDEALRQISILNTFFGPPGSYPQHSMSDVIDMESTVLEKTFSGKYIFVGEVGTLIHDSIVSPVTGTQMAGVELHAHMLDGLLQKQMLTRLSDEYLWITIVLMTIISIILYLLIPTYLSPIFAIVSLIALIGVSRYLYDIERILIDVFPLTLALGIITFPVTFVYRFFIVDRAKRHIENAFGHYIDPKMVKMIDMEEVELALGGEEKEVSVFFSDIAGFTTISESLSPTDLFYLMSSYLSRMTDILKAHGGTLDKYIGDAVMGFFGAPVAQGDHAIRSCRTALAMREALPEFNREIEARGMLAVDFRVGIATGRVLVGNIGSRDHFNYTVLGDTVNLASRLEATGKEYGIPIIISEGTHSLIADEFITRELDTIAVKGKTEGVRIYELIALSNSTIDRTIYDAYAGALELYRSGKYLTAGKIWESQMDQDEPSRIMALRCVDILEGRLAVTDGIYRMEHK